MRTAQVIEITGALSKFLCVGGRVHVLRDAESAKNFLDIFYRSISGKTVKGVLNMSNCEVMKVQRLCRNYIVNFAEAGPVMLYVKGEEEKLMVVHYNPERKEIAMGYLDGDPIGADARECCEFLGYKLKAPTSLLSTLKKIARNSLPNILQKDEDFEHVKGSLYERDYDLFEKKGNVFFPISIEEARVKGQLEFNDSCNIFYYVDFEGDIILDKKWIALVHGEKGCTFNICGKEFSFSVEELRKSAHDEDEEDEDNE